MKIQILDKTKKKKFINEISELGVEKIPYLLIKTGKERIRAFSGSLSSQELMALWRIFPVEGLGLYIGKQMLDKKTGRKQARLSLDGLHVLKDQIEKSKQVLILTKQQEEDWFKGKIIELDKKEQKLTGFVAIKSADKKDFIGFGKISVDKDILIGFLPKERRRRD